MKKPVKERPSRPAPSARATASQPEAKGTKAQVTVVNKRGLHARAAAKFVKLASEFGADVRVTAIKGGLAGGAVVSGRSIMGLMMLGAGPGAVLVIEVEGHDAAAALRALISLIDGGFEESD